MGKLARNVTIVGAGVSKFGVFPKRSSRDLFVDAFQETLASVDHGIAPNDLEALFLGNFTSDTFEQQSHLGPLIADWIGVPSIPATRIENACASSGAAFRQGVMAIASGMHDLVLVGGVEKMTDLPVENATDSLAMAADNTFEVQQAAFTFPGVFAIIASAYMDRYGISPEHLMRVAIKNHHNGSLNSKAQFNRTIQDLMEARSKRLTERGQPVPEWGDELGFLQDLAGNPLVAWPLRLFDCSPISDGASCLILASEDVARTLTDTPISVAASAHASAAPLADRDELTSIPSTKQAAQIAYSMAGINPEDVSLSEVHDCFTIAEVIASEDLGFFPAGEGALAVAEGRTNRDGEKPINTSGGLKAKGHPVGATGGAQLTELWTQLRGEAGQRQVSTKNLEYGLAQNLGGSGNSCVVTILKRGIS
ncbi:MAG: hypothetical protein FI680_01245 [SAR202 cluster bacterium]|nr:hypothetical protein [SAR202 cluster bacterium]